MILYNVTINIENDSHEEWLDWMINTHIPEILETGLFVENKLFKLQGDEDSGGVTYSVQYFAKNMDDVNVYLENHAPALRNSAEKKFGGKFVAFRSLLELVHPNA